MNKRAFLPFQWVFITIFSNAVNKGDFSNIETTEPFNLKNSTKECLLHAFQGLHRVNTRGWYLASKQTAEHVSQIHDQHGSDGTKTFEWSHNDLDLVLIKFQHSYDNKILNQDVLFESLATPKDIDEYSWVLSLTKVIPGYKPQLESPLQVVSHISWENNELVLSKGNINDFYNITGDFFRSKKLTLYTQRLNQIGLERLEDKKSFFIKNHVEHNINSQINQLEQTLNNLKLCQNVILNGANFLSREKIDIGLRPVDSLLRSSLESLQKEIQCRQKTRDHLLSFSNSLDNPEVNTLWNRNLENLQGEKKLIQYKKKKLLKKSLSHHSINDIWGFDTDACNGIADSSDIGGGIYSYPQPFSLLNTNSLPVNKLIGITIPGGIEGETSKALNLTTQNIREWILKGMLTYYEKWEQTETNPLLVK